MWPSCILASSVTRNGLRVPVLDRRVSPKRELTSYLYRFVVGSKPRTVSSDGSEKPDCPHPCSFELPCSSSSSPAGKFVSDKLSVTRFCIPSFSGLSVTTALVVAVHGPSQLL